MRNYTLFERAILLGIYLITLGWVAFLAGFTWMVIWK